jgi:SAM-dependent methyltransferase
MTGEEVLRRFEAGELPAPVALLQLIQCSGSEKELRSILSGRRPARQIVSLLERRPGAFALVRHVLAVADHRAAGSADPRTWARVFDALAEEAPTAAAALYAFGDENLIEETSREIVAWLADAGLLDGTSVILVLGCGTGRLVPGLAAAGALVVGLDISAGMLAEARRRCRGVSRAAFLRGNGVDLAMIETGCVDLLVAVDVFPYVPDAGRPFLLAEVARVVRPGGHAVVMNWSYDGDAPRHAVELAETVRQCPLSLSRAGDRPFRLWDGAVFVLSRDVDQPARAPSSAATLRRS